MPGSRGSGSRAGAGGGPGGPIPYMGGGGVATRNTGPYMYNIYISYVIYIRRERERVLYASEMVNKLCTSKFPKFTKDAKHNRQPFQRLLGRCRKKACPYSLCPCKHTHTHTELGCSINLASRFNYGYCYKGANPTQDSTRVITYLLSWLDFQGLNTFHVEGLGMDPRNWFMTCVRLVMFLRS